MTKSLSEKGILYLIPSALGENDIANFISPDFKITIFDIDEFIVENIRTTRRYLRSIGYDKNFDAVIFHELNEHTNPLEISSFLESLRKGKNIGLLSEAGCPCIADPGSQIVKIAQSENIRVVPLVGPSSIILGLMASGFNGQNFAFNGYLPVEQSQRIKKIKELESIAIHKNQTQIFIETPYRNMKLFEDIIKSCFNQTSLCIATDICQPTESIKTKTILQWKTEKLELHKKPSVFLISK